MKRDMDLLRKILFYVEENYRAGQGFLREIPIDGYEPEVVSEHIALAYEAGLIQEVKEIRMLRAPVAYWVGNLSNEGYDLLDKIREETIWNKTKGVIKEKGLPLVAGTIKTVATAFITAAAEGVANSIIKNGGQV